MESLTILTGQGSGRKLLRRRTEKKGPVRWRKVDRERDRTSMLNAYISTTATIAG